jgi:hypothetical protein
MVFLPLMLIWLRDPMYFNAPSRWAMVALAASIGVLAPNLSSGKIGNAASAADFNQTDPASRALASSASSSMIREGTRWTNRVGQFTQSEGGWFFTPVQTESEQRHSASSTSQDGVTTPASMTRSSTGSRIRVLENLALQRVAQIIQQDPSDNRWMINGVVTEFFGENRLLMTSVVRAPIDDSNKP